MDRLIGGDCLAGSHVDHLIAMASADSDGRLADRDRLGRDALARLDVACRIEPLATAETALFGMKILVPVADRSLDLGRCRTISMSSPGSIAYE